MAMDELLGDPQHDVQCRERQKITRLQQMVHDLQSGMYINCVYCGHRYGPKGSTPATMADILKQHIETCPKHPMCALRKENQELKQLLKEIQNGSVQLRHRIADTLNKLGANE